MIHVLDYHFIPLDLYALDRGDDSGYRAYPRQVEQLQEKQAAVLRQFLKARGINSVFAERVTPANVGLFQQRVENYRKLHQLLADAQKLQGADGRRVEEECRKSLEEGREAWLDAGVAGRLAAEEGIETVPLDDEKLLDEARPQVVGKKLQFDPAKVAAQANLGRFHAENNRLRNGRQLAESLQVLAAAPAPALGGGIPLGWAAPGPVAGAAAWDIAVRERQAELVRRYMEPALRHALYAHAVCPLAAKPYLLLAANAPYLERGQPPLAYLERAKALVTNDPQLWFLFGCHELLQNRLDDACASWRHSLDLAPDYLDPILDLARQFLDASVILERVLPASPPMLLAAAEHAYPAPGQTEQRSPYLNKAMALLRLQPGPRSPEDLHLRAQLHRSLGQSLEAVQAYHRALEREPNQLVWRLELAQILGQRGEYGPAKEELMLILRTDPKHPEARKLFEEWGSK